MNNYGCRYYDLLDYAFQLFRNKESAEDIVNDILLKITDRKIQFHDEDHFEAYVRRSIQNAHIDEYKKQNRHESNKEYFYYLQEKSVSIIDDNAIAEHKMVQALESGIKNLPGHQKKVLELIYYQGLKTKEIASRLNISERNVIKQKYRAINKLRNKIHTGVPADKETIEREIVKKEADKLCLRIRNGRIEIIIEQSDGTWLLSDGTMELANGIYVFARSKWTIILKELEMLINKSDLKEKELQDFFESYPELVLGDEYDCIFPQATIVKDDKTKWRADFVLVPSDQLSFSKILELKLPTERISIIDKCGHSQYSNKLFKAINQLKDYYQAFESDRTRQLFKNRYQTEVFKPDLQLVIGRRSSISNCKDFLELQRRNNIIMNTWDSLHEQLSKKYK